MKYDQLLYEWKHSNWRSKPILLLTFIFFSCSAPIACCTSYRTPPAIESNVLAFDGKIAFIQGTGGLTVLDVNTGSVIRRKKLRDQIGYIDELVHCPTGLLLIAYRSASLVGPNSFEHRWTIEDLGGVVTEGPFLIGHDGYHHVRCHDLTTGEEKWSKEFRGGWDLTLSQGILVVSTAPYNAGQSALWVIDADSGTQLFQKTAPQNRIWSKIYFDGKAVYALTASLDSLDLYPVPEEVFKYDIDGRELARLEFSSSLIAKVHEEYPYPFLIDGKIFTQHEKCRRAYEHELDPFEDERMLDDSFSFSLPSGLLSHDEYKDSDNNVGHTVQLIQKSAHWANHLPYLQPHEWLQTAEEFDGRVILCWSGGQIECLNVETGRPQWMYVFPSFRRLLSYSNCYIGDYWRGYEIDRVKVYYRGLSFLGEACGSIPMTSGPQPLTSTWAKLANAAKYPGTITVDPVPDLVHPIPEVQAAELPGRLLSSKVYTVASVLGLLGLIAWHIKWHARKGSGAYGESNNSVQTHLKYGIVGSMAILCITSFGLFEYGRVSIWCNVLLSCATLIALGYSWWTVAEVFKDRSPIFNFVWQMFTGFCACTILVLRIFR